MRLRNSCRLLVVSVSASVLAGGVPGWAQDTATYEYAEPASDAPVIFTSEPIVQPLPGSPPLVENEVYDVEAMDMPAAPAPPVPPVPPVPPMRAAIQSHATLPPPAAYGPVPGAYAPGAYVAPYAQHGYAHPVENRFNRAAWLDDCHRRIRGVDREDRAAVIGGLLGAIAGGVVGNRVWDSERLAGTLLGAGVGGLAGVAIGSAVDAASDRRHDDECARYLDSYMAGGYPQTGYPGVAYGYGYPGYAYGGYTLVPVMVAVPQRQVIRETVTEEWVDEPVRTRSIPRRPRQPATAPDKRIKLIKGK